MPTAEWKPPIGYVEKPSEAELQKQRIDNLFEYHAPTPLQQLQYAEIRKGAKAFAKILLDNTNTGPDQARVMALLRSCVHFANGNVAMHGDSGF